MSKNVFREKLEEMERKMSKRELHIKEEKWQFIFTRPKKKLYHVEARYGKDSLFYDTKKKPYLDDSLIRKIAKATKLKEETVKLTFSKNKKLIDGLKVDTKREPEDIKISEEALQLCQDKEFFKKVKEEVGKKVVQEEQTIHTILLCASGRLVENANLASFNLLVNSESGAGKDYVASKTLALMPKNDYIRQTRITEKAFTYWHNSTHEPDWTWDNKVFYCEDISTNVLNSEVFKVMCSSGSKAVVVINQIATEIEIKGKPVIITTTASASPNKEMLRRFTILPLDESIDQTKEIHKAQARAAVQGKTLKYNPLIMEALAAQKPVKVKVPWAENLIGIFPSQHLIMRTHFDRFIDYIKASAAFHQYQREEDEEGYILAIGQDYEIAKVALLKTSSNKHMVPLTKNLRRILDIMGKLTSANLDEKWFSIPELEPHVTFCSDRVLYQYMDKLTEYGFLKKDKQDREGSKKPVMVWKYQAEMDIKLPNWEEIDCKN